MQSLVVQHGFHQNRSVATSPVEPQGHVEGASSYSLQGAYQLLSQIWLRLIGEQVLHDIDRRVCAKVAL